MITLQRHYRWLQDETTEVLDDGVTAIVHDKVSDKYYATHSADVPDLTGWVPYSSRISLAAERLFIAAILAFCVGVLVYYFVGNDLDLTVLRAGGWAVLLGYTIFQVCLHECAHLAVLRLFGKKLDKCGFRMNFGIFPAFYVRMNQAHLLPRGERAIVHSAGLAVNSAVVECRWVQVVGDMSGHQGS